MSRWWCFLLGMVAAGCRDTPESTPAATAPLAASAAPATDAPVSEPAAPPVAPPGADAIATVLGEPITAADLGNDSTDRLTGAILWPLLEQFREQHRLVATDAEVARYLEFFQGEPAAAFQKLLDEVNADDPEEEEPLDAEVEAEILRELAVDSVLQWKTSKALHERYGGRVIFQQANPLEPVGAYLAFLREHEERGSFQFHDAAAASRFWKYFTTDHSWVVEPEQVDYSKPWWEQVDERRRK